MKKLAGVIGVVLVLFVGGPLWWNLEAPSSDSPRHGAAGAAAALHAAADTTAVAAGVERTVVPVALPGAVAMPDDDARVAIDLTVRVVWQASRQPAARVPITLLVQPNALLAYAWTDNAGTARFVLGVAARHWSAGSAARSVSVATPLRPGRYFPCTLTTEAGTLEVALDDGESVAGIVVDPAGNPVPGADVRLTTWPHSGALVASADAAGAFALRGLPADFVLRASAGTMESAPANIASLAGGTRLVLRLGAGGDQVQVRVLAGGAPVADATVRLATGWRNSPPPRELVGHTDDAGIATFAGVPADAYVVEVVHRAHPPAQRSLTTAGIGITHTQTVELGEAATLVGLVRCGGKPTAWIRVMVEGADSLFHQGGVRTDRDGRFTLDQLAVGPHTVMFARDTAWQSRRVTLRAGQQLVEFDLPGGYDIVGRLLLPDGAPAVQWKVVAQSVEDSASRSSIVVTDAAGRFTCANLPASHYTLVATGAEGGGHTFFTVHTGGASADYRLPAAALWRPARITGRIEGAPSRSTLFMAAGAGDVGRGQQLDGDGAIALGPLAPGRYRLWLAQDDDVLWLTEVELGSGQVLYLGVVALPRPGTLAVTVRGGEAVDASRAHVLLRAAVTNEGESFGPRPRLTSDGTWHCQHVPAGEWWLTVAGDGIAPEVRKLTIEPEGKQSIEVVLSPAVPVEVHFVVPAADALSVGWRRATVRRVGDGAIMVVRSWMGPLHTQFDLARGSYTIEVETGGGYFGSATFAAPASDPVAVPLVRR